MKTSMKAGGVAAIIQALCYVCGFAMIASVLNPGDTENWSNVRKLEFMLELKLLLQLWNIVIYVLFGIALVVLAATLHGLLKPGAPILIPIATPFGYIWAGLVIASGMVANIGLETLAEMYIANAEEAAAAWRVISTVQDGLGGGVEIVGGIWVLLISIASLKDSALLPRALSLVGLFVGVTGILTVVPALGGLGAVFGISQIIWFVFLGVVLLRGASVNRGRAEQT